MEKKNSDTPEKGKETVANENLPVQIRVEDYLNRKYEFLWNEILKDCFYREKPEHQGEEPQPFKKVEIGNLWRELARHGFKYSLSNLECTLCSDFVTRFNPIASYFDKLPKWDGKTDYIEELCKHVVLENETDEEIKRLYTMFKKWLVRCIRCALGGAINREVIMFKSDEQRIGKTQFFRYLAPKDLKDYYMENPEIGNKDALISLTENLIINFDEYDKYLKEGNLPVMKSYISQDEPKVRAPYGRKQEKIKRICSCVASTNINDFLRDETGNTRYICFDIKAFDWREYTKIDVNLVWAQIYHLYKLTLHDKYDCEMTAKEIDENNQNNLQYLYHSSEYELIQRYFEPSINGNDFKMNTQIVDWLKDNTRYKNITSNAVGRALTALGYKKVHSKANNAKQGYLIKEKKQELTDENL